MTKHPTRALTLITLGIITWCVLAIYAVGGIR